MPEVGIERLGPGHGKKHRAQRDKADHAVMDHERDGIERIERQQHLGVAQYLRHRRNRQHGKPDAHDGPEERGDTRGAPRLDRKQRHQDQHGQRHDIMLEGAVTSLMPSIADSTDNAGVITASP